MNIENSKAWIKHVAKESIGKTDSTIIDKIKTIFQKFGKRLNSSSAAREDFKQAIVEQYKKSKNEVVANAFFAGRKETYDRRAFMNLVRIGLTENKVKNAAILLAEIDTLIQKEDQKAGTASTSTTRDKWFAMVKEKSSELQWLELAAKARLETQALIQEGLLD